MTRSSRIEGFYKLERRERLKLLAEKSGLPLSDLESLTDIEPLAFDAANHMVENAVSVFGLPFGIGLNFRVNGSDYLVPMVVEEPSVIAAASHAARIIRQGGGFTADTDEPVMIAQVQVVRVPDLDAAVARLSENRAQLIAAANDVHPNMVKRGGGTRDIEARVLRETAAGPMLIVHILVNVGDAMGANAVNTIAEALAPTIAELTGGEIRLRILSNLADRRCARAECRIPFAALDTADIAGSEVAQRVFEAWAFADADPYRAATHNKGVMNGIDAVAIATGNDWRAIEAGAHAFAARDGRYRAMSQWTVEADHLVGRIEIPLALGIVGGNLEVNPRVAFALKLLGVTSARELAGVMVASGLGQNFSAMRAMVTDGIQKGHMSLHARGIAIAAGASEELVESVVERMIAAKEIKLGKAREILAEMRPGGVNA